MISVFDADEDGDPTGVQNGVEYDAENRIVKQTFNLSSTTSFVTSYNYATSGSIATETLKYLSGNHKINYNYDNFNRLDSVVSDLGAFDYTKTYTYYTDDNKNTSTRISSYVSNVNGSSTTYTYDYDPRGNITVITQGGTETIYTYDDIGQLTQETNGTTNRYYTYDNAGNIVSIESQLATSGGGGLIIRAILPPPSTSHTTTLGYTDSEWGDLLTSYNGTTITYDEIGNPLSYYNGTAYTFTWEGRRLVGAVKGTKTMSFTYNDDGIRTSKTVNGVKHTYYLNGNLIMAEQWEDKLLVYLYDASGSPIGMMYRTTSYASDTWDTFWYEKNLFGDIVAIYNESGTKVVSYSYTDAWGNHSVSYSNGGGSTGAQYNPFRYRGYYYDTDLEMYYLQSRYYDSAICRFINADGYVSTGQGVIGNNMFAYCNNNPVMYVDHSGGFAIPIAIPIIQYVIVGLLVVGMVALIADATGEQVLGNIVSEVVDGTVDAINNIVNLFDAENHQDKTDDIILPPSNQVVFPANPYEFNPVGLNMVIHEGTKNGKVISWMDPATNTAIFRWDENVNKQNGPHYHITGDPNHYYFGDVIPEPYSTIYFPVK